MCANEPSCAMRSAGKRGMYCHEISLSEHFFHAQHSHVKLTRLLRGNIGVKGDDLHFESLGPSCHFCADLSQADNAENLVAYLDTQETALFPFAGLRAVIGGRYLASQGH